MSTLNVWRIFNLLVLRWREGSTCSSKISDSEDWSSQLNFQLKQLERRSLKKSGLQRDSNPWPPRYRCDALPTELWSHTLGARPIYWVHIFPCGEMMWSIYEIIHFLTAVVNDSEEWSSQLNFQFKQLERIFCFFQVADPKFKLDFHFLGLSVNVSEFWINRSWKYI